MNRSNNYCSHCLRNNIRKNSKGGTFSHSGSVWSVMCSTHEFTIIVRKWAIRCTKWLFNPNAPAFITRYTGRGHTPAVKVRQLTIIDEFAAGLSSIKIGNAEVVQAETKALIRITGSGFLAALHFSLPLSLIEFVVWLHDPATH